MPHFLIEKEEIKKDTIELKSPDNLFHLVNVLRVKAGEIVKFIDLNQYVYTCKVLKVSKKSLNAKILSTEKSNRILKHNRHVVHLSIC